jgi:hypothetical protein
MSNYPRWKYHASKPAVIVEDAEAEKNLGSGWHNAPVKGNTDVDPSQGIQGEGQEVSTLTGDDVFDQFLADNGLDKVSNTVKAQIRIGYDHVPTSTGTIPAIEYGHPVGPQDSVTMVDSETARKALLKQAKEMGVEVHHASSSKTIQAAIDAFVATKSATPAAATALPKDTDVTDSKDTTKE